MALRKIGTASFVSVREVHTPACSYKYAACVYDSSQRCVCALNMASSQIFGTKDEDKYAAKHTEVEALFAKLCNRLDLLSNFHYTPKVCCRVHLTDKIFSEIICVGAPLCNNQTIIDAEAFVRLTWSVDPLSPSMLRLEVCLIHGGQNFDQFQGDFAP